MSIQLQIYPDPEKYEPDRFSPEAVKNRHPMAWLAFGDGPRNCIGLRFGMMQARVGLISLISRFKFSPCSQTPIPMVFGQSPIVLSPRDPVYLEIEPILNWKITAKNENQMLQMPCIQTHWGWHFGECIFGLSMLAFELHAQAILPKRGLFYYHTIY